MDIVEEGSITRKREFDWSDNTDMADVKRPKLNETFNEESIHASHTSVVIIPKSPLELTPYDTFELIAHYLTHRKDIIALLLAGSQIINRRLVSSITSLQVDDNQPYNHLLACFTKLKRLSVTNTKYDNADDPCTFVALQVEHLSHLQEVVIDAPVPNISLLLDSLPRGLQTLQLGCIAPHKCDVIDGNLFSRFHTLRALSVSPFNQGPHEACHLKETSRSLRMRLSNSHCLPQSLIELIFVGSIVLGSSDAVGSHNLPPRLEYLAVDVLSCHANKLPSTLKLLFIRYSCFVDWQDSFFLSPTRPPLLVQLTTYALCSNRPVFPDNVTHVILVESCCRARVFNFNDVRRMPFPNLKRLTMRPASQTYPDLPHWSMYPPSLEEIDIPTCCITERNARLHIPKSITSLTARSVLLEYGDVKTLLTIRAPNLQQLTCNELCVSLDARRFIEKHRVGPKKSLPFIVNERKCI